VGSTACQVLEVDRGREIGNIRSPAVWLCKRCSSVGLVRRLGEGGGHLDRRLLCYSLGVRPKGGMCTGGFLHSPQNHSYDA